MTVRRRCVCTSAMRFAQIVGSIVGYGARVFRAMARYSLGQPRERFPPPLDGKGKMLRDKQREGDVLCTSAREFVLVPTLCAFTRNADLLSVTAPVRLFGLFVEYIYTSAARPLAASVEFSRA